MPRVEKPITRMAIETSIAVAWNAAGARRGLSPIAWRLGSPDDGVHFAGDADAYAPELRQDIIEAWIASLGLADEFNYYDEPLGQCGSNMVWTGTIDSVTFQLSYPASMTA
jgi:hypothetical protein